MKKTGLKNRFPKWVHFFWQMDWYDCMVCDKNMWNALHHIISSSIEGYKDGKHNESILNSCPIHNYKHPHAEHLKNSGYSGGGIDLCCHIGNEAWLGKNVPFLLKKTKKALEDLGYKLKPIDHEFIKIYKEFYE